MLRPNVSVIVPTFNRAQFLPLCCASIVSQSESSLEVLIVDDRSTDETKEVVEKLARRDSRIQYLYNSHQKGPSGARNTGLELAQGEFIAFLDSDDAWHREHIKETLAAFAAHPQLDWVFADINRVKYLSGEVVKANVFRRRIRAGRGMISGVDGKLLMLPQRSGLAKYLKNGVASPVATTVLRRSLCQNIRFDEDVTMGEDSLFFYRCLADGARVAFIDEVHATYHVHDDNSCLASQQDNEAERLRKHSALELTYRHMLASLPLNSAEIRLVQKNLSDHRFWGLGYNTYCANKNTKAALQHMWRGIQLDRLSPAKWKALLACFFRHCIASVLANR